MTKTEFKTLKPSDVVAVFDTREQLPYILSPLQAVEGSLATGDYSLLGYEHYISVERKSLNDLLGCIGRERERFERELMRLKAYPVHALVIEATWNDILAGGWRSKIHPNSVYGSLVGWIEFGINIIMAGDRDRGQHLTAALLFTCARRRWEDLQKFAPSLKISRPPA